MTFVAPELEIAYFSAEDVLTSSQEFDETTTTLGPGAFCPAELPMD